MPIENPAAQEFSLPELLDLLRRRKWTVVHTACFFAVLGTAAALLSPAIYKTSAKLLVETPGGLVLSQVDTTNALSPLMMMRQQNSVETQLEVLRSSVFAQRVMKKAGTVPVGVKLSYEPIEATSIITVNAESADPAAAVLMANSAAEEYVGLTRESNRTALNETRQFLEESASEAKRELALTERKLLLFKSRTRMEDSEEARSIRLKDAVDLESRARESRQERRALEAKIAGLKRRLAREPRVIRESRVKTNPEVEPLQSQIASLKAERAVALGIFQPTSTRVRGLDSQIVSLEATLAGMAPTVRDETERPSERYAALRQQLDELELQHEAAVSLNTQLEVAATSKTGRVENFAPWQVELTQLQRDRDLAAKTYIDYSEKLRDLNVRERAMAAGATVMEAALTPTAPVGPGKPFQMALAVAVGLLLGLAFGFLQEMLDDRINNPDDIERLTTLPVLGAVPAFPAGQEPLVSGLPANSHLAEAYRSLRSSIHFAALDRPIQRLLVTSCSQGEGKTVTSLNLATAMAMEGRRVILVDADLRRPGVHRLLGRENSPGLSQILIGMQTVDQVVQDTQVPNLRVICSGPIPPNPAELLNSPAFDATLAELSERADIVVIDSPPCVPVTDPLIISSRVDGVVLVLNVGETRRGALKHVMAQLGRARARVLGILFNRVDTAKGAYYYHQHYYGGAYYSEAIERAGRFAQNGKHADPLSDNRKLASLLAQGDEDRS